MNQPAPEAHPTAELAALYAAGALESAEHHAFEQLLATGNTEVLAALHSFDPVVEALAGALPQVAPPPRIREALLVQIAKIRPGDPESAPRSSMIIQRAFDAAWEDTPLPGVRRRILRRDPQRGQITMLIRMAAGACIPGHVHEGPEESFILEGDLRVGNQVLHEGDHQFAPAGSVHDELYSENGCLALVIAPLALAIR